MINSTKIFGASREYREKHFIEKINNKYPNCYDFSKVKYTNKNTKVELICLKCKEIFFIYPSQFNKNEDKVGCQKCNIKNRAINRCLTKEQILLKINNNWEVINWNNYINSNCFINIKCSICYIEHSSSIHNLMNGLGCYNCYNKIRGNTIRLPQDKVIEKFIKVWGDEYDYKNINYISMWTKIKINCKFHGEFTVYPHDHLNKSGCTKCSKKHCSKIQIDWIKFMEIHYNTNIQHAFSSDDGEFKIPGTKYKADGYSKELNTIFEFHGDFYHGNPKFYDKNQYNPVCKQTFGELYNKTLIKENKIKELGYNLITIWEYQWKNLIKYTKIIQKKYRNKKRFNL
jgi:hypothetical protein